MSRRDSQEYGQHSPEEQEYGSRSVDEDTVRWVVPLVVGSLLTGGFGVTAVGLAASTLRFTLAAAYGGLATVATPAAVAGTGYLTVQGGRLIVTRAQPGIIQTIRAANRAAGGIRTGLELGSESIRNTASQGIAATSNAGTATREIVVNVGASGAAHLANLYPEFPALFDAATRRTGQSEVPLRFYIQDQPQDGLEDPAAEDIGDGGPTTMRNQHNVEGDAIEMHLMLPDGYEQHLREENNGDGSIHEGPGHNSARESEIPEEIGDWAIVHYEQDEWIDSDQDITDINLRSRDELADDGWSFESASFHTAIQ